MASQISTMSCYTYVCGCAHVRTHVHAHVYVHHLKYKYLLATLNTLN